jgi:CheY-like chemotaxis protein
MTHVLVVDDDQGIREVLTSTLQEEGYVVSAVADGEAALTTLRAAPERMVVLLDYMLPARDGLSVLQAVAAEATLAERHAYTLLTAQGRTIPHALAHLLAHLGIPLVRKPFDLDAIVAGVQYAAQRIEDTSTAVANG